jgi:hypothetical protein
MRRPTVPAAVAALALAFPVVLLGSSPAHAAAVFVESNPSTVPAGDEIGLRASCDDNLRAAVVTADPFGRVTVSPRYGFLTATVRVPATTKAGDFRVRLRCPDGASATTTLHVVARDRPTRGPATGGGGTAGTAGTVPVLIGGGFAAMAAGLVLGVLALRRRQTG